MLKSKFYWVTIILSSLAIVMSSAALVKSCTISQQWNSYQSNPQQFVEELINRAKECVLFSPEISSKESVLALLDGLETSGSILESGTDELRIKYVHSQGSIEHVLACAMVLGELKQLIGVIHTPTPATPLCTEVDNLDSQLLDPSIRYDLDKLLTVKSRAVILRNYLEKGGILYVVYPQGGLEKRSTKQQEIYKKELAKYTDRLIDAMLNSNTMDPDKVGATYFFKNAQGNLFAFSIKARQANDPADQSEWGLWLGAISHPLVSERVKDILDYLEAHDGPQIRKEINHKELT